MSVTTLLSPRSSDVIFADLLAKAEAKGMSARGWQAQQIAYVLTSVQADTSADWEAVRKTIVNGGYPTTAKGAWLDLVAAGWYQELRIQPLTTVVQLRLSDSVNGGPYVLSPGQIAMAIGVGGTPLYYRSSQTIQIPRSGYVDIPFSAESPGAAYNVGPTQITSLRTPVPGVAVTSPAMPVTGTILLSVGADDESDAALAARCIAKWSTLGRGWSATAIQYLIQQCDPGATRFLIRDPGDLPWTVEAYLADVAGPLSSSRVLAIYNYLKDRARKPGGNYPVLTRPATLMSVSQSITLYSDGTNPNVQVNAAARLNAFLSTSQIGQTVYSSREIDELVDAADGCIAVSLSPEADIVAGYSDAIVITPSYSVVQV